MATFPINNRDRIRVDNRVNTLGSNNEVFVGVRYPPGFLIPISLHGYLIIGFDANFDGDRPWIVTTKPIYDLGVFYRIQDAFGGVLPAGYGSLKWSCFFAPRLTGFSLQTFGIS